MYVADLLPSKDEVLMRALASPKIKAGTDHDAIMRVVFDTVAATAKTELEYTLTIDITDVVALYEATNGKYEDLTADEHNPRARDDYGSGLDDAVEEALQQYIRYLSADWLGRSTIGTDLWEDKAIEGLAKSAAAEIWKQLTYDKTPAQVLASAGIVAADIQDTSTKDTTTMAGTLDLTDVMAKIKAHVGKDFDRVAVYDDFDMVCNEDDEILCNAAGARIGLTPHDIETIQIGALSMEDAPTELVEMLDGVKLETGKARVARTKAEKDQAKAEGSMSPVVFEAMKDCGVADNAMAEALGVSRSTYINYGKGKTAFVPTDEQAALIRLEVVTRLNKLAVALAQIDGTEFEAVE